MKSLIKQSLRRLGYDLRRAGAPMAASVESVAEPEFRDFLSLCRPYTMTSPERLYGLYKAMRHVHRRAIAGDFVECGVWRGGSSMMAALTLRSLKDTERRLFLYDTFEGMTPPGEKDRDRHGTGADIALQKAKRENGARNVWCFASIEDVRANLALSGLDERRFHLVKGRVEDTIPATVPEKISVLRLDTDWFDSTWHELKRLYSRLQPGGVLIVDDYGHWMGAREAVDRFFAECEQPILLTHLDYTGVIGVKA